MLQRFNENRCRPSTAFMLKILVNVSISGRGVGVGRIQALGGGGGLKGTKVSHLCDYFK